MIVRNAEPSRLLLAAAIATLAPAGAPALAGDAPVWRFAAETGSHLRFTGDYGGEPVPGGFRSFSGQLRGELADPMGWHFDVEIDIGSVDTDYEERDDVLRGSDFFASDAFPKATWTSSGGCRPAKEGVSCPGILSIRGLERPVPISVRREGLRIEGRASVHRLDFAVGAGEWADASTIAHRVSVAFTLLLQPAAATPEAGKQHGS